VKRQVLKRKERYFAMKKISRTEKNKIDRERIIINFVE